MKIIAAFILLLSMCAFAAEPKVVSLWPGAAPGSESWNLPPESDRPVPAGPGRLIRDISHPTLTIYLPDPAIATGAAVIIAPGGGFNNLAIDHEGYEVGEWLAKHGIAGFVLKYRVLPTSQWEGVDPKAAAKRRYARYRWWTASDQVRAEPCRRIQGRSEPCRYSWILGGSFSHDR